MKNVFLEFWKQFIFEKKLTSAQLEQVRTIIRDLEGQKIPSSKIITTLQEKFPDLAERYQAERAYWTESKKMEVKIIEEGAKELEYKQFKIVPSPGACPLCKHVSGSGDKIFNKSDLKHEGKPIPPIHPNCFCVLLAYD